MFNNCFFGKTVLVTGHTGFKGAWLITWLHTLGAKVVGLSNEIPTNPSMYEQINSARFSQDIRNDVRDLNSIKDVINSIEPDFLFHLAAQPIVSESFRDPVGTFTTNFVGTINILEALRLSRRSCVAILITSDKAYENVEQIWGYRETDRLGGKDVYSASKGAAELAIRAYVNSFFANHPNVRIGIARAGNVIGGGDWAKDRIVVDAVKAWSLSQPVLIRSPQATRPWQHVLEPLSGYLWFASVLQKSCHLHGEAFNFGPRDRCSYSVARLLTDLGSEWELAHAPFTDASLDTKMSEACLLKLDCDKAREILSWEATLDYAEMVNFTATWYKYCYAGCDDMLGFTQGQIREYCNRAKERAIQWME